MRWLVVLLALIVGFGCGGSSSSSSANPEVSISWGERSRSIGAPSSALSVRVSLSRNGLAPVVIEGDRPAGTMANVQTLRSTQRFSSGPADMLVVFYAETGQQGAIVGTAADRVEVPSSGRLPISISVASSIVRVQVPDGQFVREGDTKDLLVGGYDRNGALVPVSPGSAFWSVAEGSGQIQFVNQRAQGVARGAPRVVATIDGVASQPTVVRVTVVPRVTFLPRLDNEPSGLTFVNGVSRDGRWVVGTARNASRIVPYIWSRGSGLSEVPLIAGATAGVANAVSDDGRTVVGQMRTGPNTGYAYVYTVGGGTPVALTAPAGLENTNALAVNADGTVVGGYGVFEGERVPILWRQGQAPITIFPRGQINALSPDGTIVYGATPTTVAGQTMGFRWTGGGEFTTYAFPTGPRLETVLAASADGGMLGGYVALSPIDSRPAFFSPPSGIQSIAGGIGTVVQAVRSDGRMMGGGSLDPGLAFIWDPVSGLRSLDEVIQRYDARFGTGIVQQFVNAGLAPASVFGISADGFTIVGQASGSVSSPTGFVLETDDLSEFRY